MNQIARGGDDPTPPEGGHRKEHPRHKVIIHRVGATLADLIPPPGRLHFSKSGPPVASEDLLAFCEK